MNRARTAIAVVAGMLITALDLRDGEAVFDEIELR